MSLKNPNVWGQSTWNIIHGLAYIYPQNPSKKLQKEYKIFFKTLPIILPCKICRDHLNEYYKKHSINSIFQSKNKLLNYTIDLHNFIRVSYQNQLPLSNKDAKREIYIQFHKTPWHISEFKGESFWIFLFCTVSTFPKNSSEHVCKKYMTMLKVLSRLIPVSTFQQTFEHNTCSFDENISKTQMLNIIRKMFQNVHQIKKNQVNLELISTCFPIKKK